MEKRLIAWCLIGLFFGATGVWSFAEDWPHWTGPLGRNAANEIGLPDHFDRSTGENIRWETRLGEVAFGSPVVADGRIYVGTNMAALRDDPRFGRRYGGVLVCLDEATGERRWILASPERTQGLPRYTFLEEQRWGICSSPTVDGDRVYVVTNGDDLLCLDVNGQADGNDGPFVEEASYMAGEGKAPVALLPSDGDILWRYDIPRELEVAPHDVGSCSVLVVGDVIYTSTSNGIGRYRAEGPSDAVNPDAPAFIALNKYTGALLAVDDTPISRNLFHAQWAPPSFGTVGDRDLVFLGGSDGYCYAFDALGQAGRASGHLQTVWSFDANPPDYRFDGAGEVIEYGRGDHRAYVRKMKLNREIAAINAQSDGGNTATKDYKVSVEGYNASDGTFVGPSEILGSPVFYDNKIYVLTGRDPLHGLGRGALSCIDARGTGDISKSGLRWRYENIGRSMSTVAIADGLVYATDLQGRLYCLDAGMGVLYWQHDTGHEIWGNPLVADGKVYVNTRQSFWMFAAGRKKEVLFESRGGSETGPIAANGVVYAFIRGQLYAIAADDNPSSIVE